MSAIKLSPKLSVPVEIVTDRTAILAKTGAGKSNTAKVIVEGALDAGAQVVILDPVGHWWGLRSLFPIPVLGGMSGDVPLDPLSGKLIASVVVESGQSLVLDVSGMDSDGQMQRFAKDFAKTLYDLKQAHPTAMLLVLEEADEFAPQDTRGTHVPEMVGAFARIAKRGRGRGIGLLPVTLRSAALSKNVLNQSDRVIAMRTTAPLDIKAVKDWLDNVEMAGASDIPRTLPGLATGEAWVIDSQNGVLARVMIAKARSLDTSATPKVGAIPPALRGKLKPIDLTALGERMSSMAEKARENDPAELRKEVARLRSELAKKAGERVEVPVDREVRVEVPVEVRVEVPVVNEEKLTRIVEAAEKLAGYDLEEFVDEIRAAVGKVARRDRAPAPSALRSTPTRDDAIEHRQTSEIQATVAPSRNGSQNGGLTGPQQRILDGLAWWGTVGVSEPTRGQLGFVVGYHSRSKGFTNALSSLSSAGLLSYPAPGIVALTGEGSALANHPESYPTEGELQAMIFEQIGPARTRILQAVIERGAEVTREELATEMGYHPRSKGFTNAVSRLSSLGLVDYPRPGVVAASSLCFLS